MQFHPIFNAAYFLSVFSQILMIVMETETIVIVMLRAPIIRMERTPVPATWDIVEVALRVKVCVHFN